MAATIDLPTLEAAARLPRRPTRSSPSSIGRSSTLDLPPGARLSEAEVARQMGVSRQPVRDAFCRLSQLGFLTIRPQRATTVSPISERRGAAGAVHPHRARDRDGARSPSSGAADEALADAGAASSSSRRRRWRRATACASTRSTTSSTGMLCDLAGHGFAWALIREQQGAHGPGALPEPRLRRRAGAGRPPGDSRRPGGGRHRRGRGADAHPPRTHLGDHRPNQRWSTPSIWPRTIQSRAILRPTRSPHEGSAEQPVKRHAMAAAGRLRCKHDGYWLGGFPPTGEWGRSGFGSGTSDPPQSLHINTVT